MTKRRPLIAYAFADRRDMPCYRCGGTFKEGRYREHILTSKHPVHVEERKKDRTKR